MTPGRIVATLDRPSVALALSAATILLPILFVVALQPPLDQPFAKDVTLYLDAADRWLAGGPFYEPRQLAGPYEVAHGDILYPPVGLWLFAPAAILPEIPALILWWGIPAALTAWAIHRVRPRPAVWPLIALCLAWPTTPLKIWTGNPVIWSMAAMAVAIVWRGGCPVRAAEAQPVPVRPVRDPATSVVDRARDLRRAVSAVRRDVARLDHDGPQRAGWRAPLFGTGSADAGAAARCMGRAAPRAGGTVGHGYAILGGMIPTTSGRRC